MRVAVVAVLVGCAYATPQTFSAGRQWTFPLVDPLRDSKLVTTMLVDGRGPFLVVLDPEARQTLVDREVVTDNWGERVKAPVDLNNIVLGELTVATLSVGVNDRDGKFDIEGRRIAGVIGRDVLADSLGFGFDRDRGVAWLAREVAPGNGTPLHFRDDRGLRVAQATLGGKTVAFALELGETASQLRRTLWEVDGLHPHQTSGSVIDHFGGHRDIAELGVAGALRVDTTDRDGLGFVVYDAGSGAGIWSSVDGTLGLDFFRPFVVTAAWPDKIVYLSRRTGSDADVTARLGRWGRQLLDACASPGCVALTLVRHERDDGSERVQRTVPRGWLADLTDGPPATFTFHAARDAISDGNDLQVVIAATAKDGHPLPLIEVDLPATAQTATAPADPRYDGATFKLEDVSPFPRFCGRGVVGCIMIEPAPAP
jgi:hypothetical protein